MPINWPANVNLKHVAPYAIEEKLPVIEDESDAGIPTRMRVSTKPIVTHSFGLSLTFIEFETLRKWVANNLNCGVLSFYFTTPLNDEVKSGRFVLDDNSWYSDFQYAKSGITLTVKIMESME